MTANLAVRREAAVHVGGFDEIFDHPHFREDTDFAWRVQRLGEIPFSREARVVHPVMPRSERRESAAERAHFFEKDPVLFEKHPERYPDLFFAEENYAKVSGFWEAFRRGMDKFGVSVELSRLAGDERVRADLLPPWILETVRDGHLR